MKKIRIKPEEEEENKTKVTGPTFDQRRPLLLISLSSGNRSPPLVRLVVTKAREIF